MKIVSPHLVQRLQDCQDPVDVARALSDILEDIACYTEEQYCDADDLPVADNWHEISDMCGRFAQDFRITVREMTEKE